jgi:hypothetical protein
MWLKPNQSDVIRRIAAERERCLAAYRSQPSLIEEHYQIELVQNAADAIQAAGVAERGRVEVVLTDAALYCANTGCPFDAEGASSLLLSHVSRKRGSQIGHFGLGFKSVLAVTDSPQVFSRSGSFGFGLEHAEVQLRPLRPTGGLPLLRLARPLDPEAEAANDGTLAELMTWATTVVKLPRDGHLGSHVGQQLRDFPVEFLLFSPHIRQVVLDDRQDLLRRSLAAWALRDGFVVLRGETGERSMWRLSTELVDIGHLAEEAIADADPATVGRGTLPLVAYSAHRDHRIRGS